MRKKLTKKGKLFFGTLIFLIALLSMEIAYLPVLRLAAETEGNKLAELSITSAVNEAVLANQIDLNAIMTVSKNTEGQIQNIVTDTAALNVWKETLIRTIEKNLDNKKCQEKLPLGTLIGQSFLYGYGPMVPIRVTLGGYSQSNIETVFDSVGINQTRYGLYLHIRTTVHTYIPFLYTNVETENTVLLGEMILVGDVPDFCTLSGSIQ